jgi:hypothetical protein
VLREKYVYGQVYISQDIHNLKAPIQQNEFKNNTSNYKNTLSFKCKCNGRHTGTTSVGVAEGAGKEPLK